MVWLDTVGGLSNIGLTGVVPHEVTGDCAVGEAIEVRSHDPSVVVPDSSPSGQLSTPIDDQSPHPIATGIKVLVIIQVRSSPGKRTILPVRVQSPENVVLYELVVFSVTK